MLCVRGLGFNCQCFQCSLFYYAIMIMNKSFHLNNVRTPASFYLTVGVWAMMRGRWGGECSHTPEAPPPPCVCERRRFFWGHIAAAQRLNSLALEWRFSLNYITFDVCENLEPPLVSSCFQETEGICWNVPKINKNTIYRKKIICPIQTNLKINIWWDLLYSSITASLAEQLVTKWFYFLPITSLYLIYK